MSALLEVTGLRTSFRVGDGTVRAVDDVSFSVDRGRTLGIVGESGSGKTVLALSAMGLLPKRDVERSGSVRFDGRELVGLDARALRDLWGAEMAMVFQDPMTSLNPVMRVGRQVSEKLLAHDDLPRGRADDAAQSMLAAVGIPEPGRRMREYPHQLSGGLRQRVMIAMALVCRPKLLFADEPTTALDVTVQAQILDLLEAQQRERFMAMVLVSHDLGVVAGRTDEIAVMYAGRIVERAPTRVLFSDVRMPYTHALMQAVPRPSLPRHARLSVIAGRPPDLASRAPGCAFAPRCPRATTLPGGDAAAAPRGHARARVRMLVPARPAGTRGAAVMAGSGTAHLRPPGDVLLRVEHLVVEFPATGRRRVSAVSDVSFDIAPGETLGLVGESGCGKSSTGRAVVQLPPPKSGKVFFEGRDLTALRREELRRVRPRLQLVLQDPISSLNPRRRVADIVVENLRTWRIGDRAQRETAARDLLDAVGLEPATVGGRRPHEFSGGQCQRISIARAVATEPKLLICDEPVSALDVSVQAQVLNLLEDLKARYGLTLLFISHDLAVVRVVSDRVAVMYLGKLCEIAEPEVLYERPAHPYTTALLAASPVARPGSRPAPVRVTGEPPSAVSPPSGCRFRTRCERASERCAAEEPVLREIRRGHFAACHHPLAGEPLPGTDEHRGASCDVPHRSAGLSATDSRFEPD